MEPRVYPPHEARFDTAAVADRPEPRRVLLCTPQYYDVLEVKNRHMEGNTGKVDRERAVAQWNALRTVYEGLTARGLLDEVLIIDGQPDCEDMVFCANQSFPWRTADGEKVAVMSKMKHASRQWEVPSFEWYYLNQKYQLLHLKKTNVFEGMGDAIPHPGKRLIYGGFGHRTERRAYNELAEVLETPVVALELVDESFYHLDTCFMPLDGETALVCPQAFSFDSLQALERMFRRVVRIPAAEAASTLSLNGHCISHGDTRVALLHYGSVATYAALEAAGYEVLEVDTSEFNKSGGSVFCLKMMMY